MPHNNGYKRRLARSATADKTRALSQAATARKLGSTEAAPQIGVGLDAGQVVITFPAAVTFARFTPAQARALADALVEQSFKAGPLVKENFFDAVRADPDMSPEQKAYWLAMEPAAKE